MIAAVVFVCLVAVGTLFFLRGYVHARRQVVPTIVTPKTPWVSASEPSFFTVVAKMKEISWQKLGWSPPPSSKNIALTFDDGPYAMTNTQLLDLLKLHHIRATFFVIGRDVQMQPELTRRIVADGHELGNHSFTHRSFVTLDKKQIQEELERNDQLIASLTGVHSRIMRPPGGKLDNDRMQFVQKLGYSVIFDNDNPGDWREDNPLREYNFTMFHCINNAVVLLHSGRQVTIKALPTMLDAWQRKGYHFVTISELAKIEGIDMSGPREAAKAVSAL
jgi:peptidoglycan/xylan/chitin deacetylase (PgdA/CDA1 family)